MKSSTVLSLLGAAATILASPVRRAEDGTSDVIPGKYIVQLKPGVSPSALVAHQNSVRSLLSRRKRDGVSASDETVEKTFSIGSSFSAYSGAFDATTAEALGALDDVLTVVPDSKVYLARAMPLAHKDENEEAEKLDARRVLTTQSDSIWSLGDMSHVEAGSNEYVYDESAGEGMTAYVFDSGIRLSHDEFEGRARFGINGITGETVSNETNHDQEGHGTHVAATLVGKTYGVAKKAQVVDAKYTEGGIGSLSSLLACIEWAVADVLSRDAANTSVFSMSLSSGPNPVLEAAILAAYEQGILSVVAAGNSNEPINETSPARMPQVLTVAMTQSDRARVNIIDDIYGSNYGPEVDVFAPGRDIVSADYRSDNGSRTETGTSMATPLVAGLVCYLRALEGPMGADEVVQRILDLALKDVVTDPGEGSPNLLVYNGSGM